MSEMPGERKEECRSHRMLLCFMSCLCGNKWRSMHVMLTSCRLLRRLNQATMIDRIPEIPFLAKLEARLVKWQCFEVMILSKSNTE